MTAESQLALSIAQKLADVFDIASVIRTRRVYRIKRRRLVPVCINDTERVAVEHIAAVIAPLLQSANAETPKPPSTPEKSANQK